MYEKYILTQGEKIMLIIISIIIIINGITSLVACAITVPAERTSSTITQIYLGIIGVTLTVSGVASLFRQRWAYIAAEIVFIIDIFTWMNYILSPQGLLLALFGLFGTAVGGAKIFFCHKCQDALSNFSQTSRRSYVEKRFR